MNEPNNIEEILDELGEAYHNNYPDQKARKKAIQAITEQVRLGRIGELEQIPWKRVDKYGINTPYVTKKWLTERKSQLKSTTLLEGDKK